MAGALTAADDDTDALSGGDGTDDTDALALPGAGLDSLAAKYPEVGAIRSGYAAAIQRLKAQRAGLSNREQLGALLVGFAQPTRHGNWREGVANASQALLAQTLAAHKQDDAREALIAKYLAAQGPAELSGAAQVSKLNAPPKTTADGDQRMRLGYAKRIFPNLSEQQIAEQNLLYDPRIDREMFRVYGARAAAAAGEPLDEEPAPAPPPRPSLEQFLGAARAANPGVSDAELTAFYQQKYGG